MPEYNVRISGKARKQLDKLPNNIAAPLLDAIGNLQKEPRPAGCKKLKGRNAYRVRVGNYRIIYGIIDDQLIVEVIALGHRKDIYQ